MLFSWFLSMSGATAPARSPSECRRYRPQLDALEDRVVPAITLVKTVSSPQVVLGQEVEYRITLTNTGPGTIGSVTIIDVVPTTFTFISATASSGGVVMTTVFAGGTSIDAGFSIIDFPGMNTATLTIRARANTVGTFTNQAEASSLAPEPQSATSNVVSLTVLAEAPRSVRIPVQSADDKQEGFNLNTFHVNALRRPTTLKRQMNHWRNRLRWAERHGERALRALALDRFFSVKNAIGSTLGF